jgi:putative transposase
MKSRTKPALRVVPTAQVQISLPVQGVLQDIKHAFYGLCIQAGREVLAQMFEADRVALCGAKNVPDPSRHAVRGGSTSSRVVLGGQRIAIKRPRVRAIDEGELGLPSFDWAAGADPLNMATMAAIAAGVSTRRYAGTLDELPPPQESLCASKPAGGHDRWHPLP